MAHVVIGAGGGTGKLCVEELLRKFPSAEIRAVVRDPEKYKTEFAQNSLVKLVAGDVTDEQSLKSALDGAKSVIFAASARENSSPKEVDEIGVGTVAQLAKAAGVERVVLISSACVSKHQRFNPIRIMLNKLRGGIMDFKLAGEALLRSSGVPYTIVRPARLDNSAAGQHHLRFAQGDKAWNPGMSSRGDCAAVCVAALSAPNAVNATFELSNDPHKDKDKHGPPPATHLQDLFAALKPDAPA